MWLTDGDFKITSFAWGNAKSIKYIYHDPKIHSKITQVLLDAGTDFFRITVKCATLAQRHALEEKINNAKLSSKLFGELDLFLASPEIPVLMQFMNLVEEIEPKVGILKSEIAELCKSGFVPSTSAQTTDAPPATVCVTAKEILKGETVLSLDTLNTEKPYFADPQPQIPGRRRSSLVKS